MAARVGVDYREGVVPSPLHPRLHLFVCTNRRDTADPLGEGCGYINDCSPGLICLDAVDFPDCAGAACCSAYCDLNDPVCSLAGTECVAFWDMGQAPPGQENLGVCVLPG